MTEVVLSPGMRVECRGAEWRVRQVKDVSHGDSNLKAVHCVGTDSLVRGHEAIFLSALDEIKPVDPKTTKLIVDTSSGFQKAKLYLEASLRQKPVTGTKPDLHDMGVFEPFQFQKEAVAKALEQPRVRLLLADDVGLGKTVQVGMILSELARRGRAARILVLAKKSMLNQFQSELWNRFTIPLTRLDTPGIARLRRRIPLNKNPFEIFQRVIISIDTLKTSQYKHFLEKTKWDVVVIDEAHNVAGASVPERHLSHKLAQLLSNTAENLILTTATPHNGKARTFGQLISLLEPSAIADPNLAEYSAKDIKPYFLMRYKEDIRKQVSEHLQEREVVPIAKTTAKASAEEEKVFDALSRIRNFVKSGKRTNSLLEFGIYKLFLSSPDACRTSLAKRLKELAKNDNKEDEVKLLKTLQDALGKQSLTDSTRYTTLLKELKEIGADGGKKAPRVVIFTEFRETQNALAEALAAEFGIKKLSFKEADQPQQPIAVMHGSFTDAGLSELVESFSTGSSPVRILIATDVASEGINLHHQCHHLIHYDLPWSIITTIQRNGRIDRFGQKEKPYIRYLMTASENEDFSGDMQIFQKLIDKVEQINHTRTSKESVLKLYDVKKEEEYVAKEGVLKGNTEVFEQGAPSDDANDTAASLEATLQQARVEIDDDLVALLSDEDEEDEAEVREELSRLRIYSDQDYLLKGYRFFKEQQEGYTDIEDRGELLLLQPPEELARYLGAESVKSDVIYGASVIPPEAYPADGEFHLTDYPHRADRAIEAARNMSGYWSQETLLTDQHPILQWVTERLLLLHGRDEAPYITSSALTKGELLFCFIGQLSSKAGSPLVSSAHAVQFLPGSTSDPQVFPLREALARADFEAQVNLGGDQKLESANLMRASAVQASLEHLLALTHKHFSEGLASQLRKEERRLREWADKRKKYIEQKKEALTEESPHYRKFRSKEEYIEAHLKSRQLWMRRQFTPADTPTSQLILAIEGV